MISEHEAHEPYLSTVADALRAAGIGVPAWYADISDPRSGVITLAQDHTRAAYGEAEIQLCWHEERGWYLGVTTDADHGELRRLRAANLGVLPDPGDVVIWAREVAAGTDPASEPVAYRDTDDEDGDEFNTELRTYWPAV